MSKASKKYSVLLHSNLSEFSTSLATCAHCAHIKPLQIPGTLYRVYKIRQNTMQKEEDEARRRRVRKKKKCLPLQSLRLPFGHISKKAKTNCTSSECGKRDTQATQKERERERREARRKQIADRRRHKTRRRQETTNGNAISSSSSSQSSIDIGNSIVVFSTSPPFVLLNVWQAFLLLRWSSAACQTS